MEAYIVCTYCEKEYSFLSNDAYRIDYLWLCRKCAVRLLRVLIELDRDTNIAKLEED